MAKIISKIGTREQRKKLKPRGQPYFEGLERGLDIGYRKGKRDGKWVVRRLVVGARKYTVETIGVADDDAGADSTKVLTYHQARDRAREQTKALAEETRIASLGPTATVRSAIAEYIDARDARELLNRAHKGWRVAPSKGLKRDARSRLKHVLADERLAAQPLLALSTDSLTKWRDGLKIKASSVRRVINDLRAALNVAARRYKAQLPPAFRDTVKDGLATVDAIAPVAREAQVLPDSDVRAIISAAWEFDAERGWGGDLGRIVLALAATGGRFSQIIRMTVADVQVAQKRVMIPVSRKGRGVKHATLIGVRVGDDVLAELAKATAGRKGSEPLFLRPHWRPIGPAKWEKGERGPWFAATELIRPWAAIVARAGLAPETVPYSLRHSSIVRGLRAGLPVRLVAALHDTSAMMIEAHYSAFIVDAMDALSAAAIVPLTTATVTPIASARR